MASVAVFGINNDGLNLAVNLLLLFLVVIWLALVYWTYADARRRHRRPDAGRLRDAARSLFPFVGTIVYMIVRPPEYLEDVRERELEMQAAEARLHQLELPALPALRPRRREGLPALPELPAQAARTPCAELRSARSTRAGRSARTARPRSRGRDAAARTPAPRGAAAPRRAPTAASDRGRSATGERASTAVDARERVAPRTEPPIGDPMDRTLILVKPDAFARGLTGEIIARFERKGLKIVALQAA